MTPIEGLPSGEVADQADSVLEQVRAEKCPRQVVTWLLSENRQAHREIILRHGRFDIDAVRRIMRHAELGPLLAENSHLGQGEVDHIAYMAYDQFLRRQSPSSGRATLIALQRCGHALPLYIVSQLRGRAKDQTASRGAIDFGVLDVLITVSAVPAHLLKPLFERHGKQAVEIAKQILDHPQCSEDLVTAIALEHPCIEIAKHPRITPEILRTMVLASRSDELDLFAARCNQLRGDSKVRAKLNQSTHAPVLRELCRYAGTEEFAYLFQRLTDINVGVALDVAENQPHLGPIEFLPLLTHESSWVRERSIRMLGRTRLEPVMTGGSSA